MADNPEDDFLASSTADPSMTLGEAAYATGAIGSSFAPGAGVADVMGYAPDPFNPGQMLPSFSENVAQGNYLDAGIQTLGLAGDAFYAAAPFTAGIAALPGGVLKGAQALAKTLRGGSIPNPKTTTPQVFFPDLGEKSHVTLQPDVKNDAVSIMYIEADKPGQGQGGEMLRRVTEQADATGTRLTLYPDPRGEGGLDQDELIEFYKRNGFEFKYPDPTNPDPILDMVREPRPTAPKSPNTVLDEIYGQDTSISVGPFALPHELDHKVKLELLPDIDDPEGAINIAGIVSTGERGEGFGTRAMKLITGKADENNLGLTLEVDPVSRGGKPDLSKEDLVTFYEREGFIKVTKNYNSETKTTTYDPIDPETNKDRFGNEWIDEMYRPPVDGRMQSLPKVVKKAEGGVVTLADVARNTGRGPRGVDSLAPIARNMYRTMVS